jgi:hypothetical protein
MKIRHKDSGEIILLPEGSYEVLNAFIVPIQCFYKKDYERVNENDK